MNKKKMVLLGAWTPVVLWMSVIFILTSLPGKYIPKTDIHGADKLVHFLEFFVLGPLMLRAFVKSDINMHLSLMVILVIALASLYAGLGEWSQNFIPGRTADVFDLFIDLLGLNIGVFMYLRGERDWRK